MVRIGEYSYLLRFRSRGAPALALRRLEREAGEVAMELIAGAATLLVEIDPRRPLDPVRLRAIESAADREAAAADGTGPGTLHTFDVRYGGADLEGLAALTGLGVEEVVTLHAAATYRVAFLGFQPGFAYLEGLPSRLHAPRLASPRPRVPGGSVAIGGEWTGIYPAPSPGGWRLIGTTDCSLFEPACEPPALLAPGDAVRFRRA